MNVGSILNGDSPHDARANRSRVSDADKDDLESRGLRSSFSELHHRHLINNLLNDAPQKGNRAVASRHDSYELQVENAGDLSVPSAPEDDDDDVDADAASIDRELAEASLKDSQEKAAKNAGREAKPLVNSADFDARNPKNGMTKENSAPKSDRSDFLRGELEKLQKLKLEKKKPHRYTEPPIWAQQWIPASQNGSSYNSLGSALEASLMPLSEPGSLRSVFNREHMTLLDLECLITGVIPPQLTVRTIAEWLYANFVEISLENRQYVELELKFGTIVSKDTGARIDIGVSTECVYTNTSNTRFEMGVHENGWTELKNFLEELEKQHADMARKDPLKPRRKFALTESNNTDYFYQITERNEKPRKIRVSKDNSLSPPRYVAISKRRVSDLYIHNPSSMYDLRLSLSIEFPVSDESIEPIMKKNKPSLQRGKKRASYAHAPTVTRFDFTEVLSPRTTKNKSGRSVTENEKSHELELEIDTFQIFRGFDRVRDGSDAIRFEELVEIFLNNARCLNNRVTKFALK